MCQLRFELSYFLVFYFRSCAFIQFIGAQTVVQPRACFFRSLNSQKSNLDKTVTSTRCSLYRKNAMVISMLLQFFAIVRKKISRLNQHSLGYTKKLHYCLFFKASELTAENLKPGQTFCIIATRQ